MLLLEVTSWVETVAELSTAIKVLVEGRFELGIILDVWSDEEVEEVKGIIVETLLIKDISVEELVHVMTPSTVEGLSDKIEMSLAPQTPPFGTATPRTDLR